MDVNQLALTVARAKADAGREAAGAHADRVIPAWRDLAFAFLELYAMNHQRFTGEDVVDAFNADPKGYERPPTDRAWGSIFPRGLRAGVMVKTKDTEPRRKGNCSPGWVYESLRRRT